MFSFKKGVQMKSQKVQEHEEKNLQWHPAFYAGIQIELQDEADNLIFENEHQLGTKPFGIDVLIIKKESEEPIRKNIGRIFRKHNIIEYKSPKDYLGIDDFYKVYGYTCFYKADAKAADSIRIEDITISLVCKNYPKKLVRHLQEEQNYKIEKAERGIYYVSGDKIPIQIIVTKQLSLEENLWLRSLTDDLEEKEDAENLIQDYNTHKENSLYQSVMNIIVQANKEKFEEAKSMCEALRELMKEEIEAEKIKANKEGRIQGEIAGKIEGKIAGKNLINELNKKLAQAGRMDDIIKAAEDKNFQDSLIEEFGL